ncbi:MAG TPA: DUF5063 domain-containing protein [Pyrinomonadaceae bacterium]|jgi:hypothetical protein
MTNELQIESSVESFAQIAQRYCDWAESPFGDANNEMHIARRFLAELHLAVITLPDLESDDTECVDLSDEWKLVLSRFQNLPVDGYWDVFYPLELEKEEPVFNMLSDDLSDIYRDLKDGLVLYKKGKIAEAVRKWKFHFDIHWGAHLTGAQRAIHAYFS